MKSVLLRTAVAFIAIVLASETMLAQASNLPQLANAAYDKHSYAEGAQLFLLAAQVQPGSASEHLYNAACCYALSGQKDLAFYSLGIAIKKGWHDKQHTESDEDLAPLRTDPRWKEILEGFGPMVEGQDNRDAMINDLNNLSAQAYQYRIRPSSMGGGQGSYAGFKIPVKMATNSNATYETLIVEPNLIRYKGTSARGFGTVEASITQNGRLLDWKYSGKFAEPPKEIQVNVIDSNRDALINHMNEIAAYCYRYRIRPTTMEGGQGSYVGVKLPENMASTDDGTFTLSDVEADVLKIHAVSKMVKGSITTTLDKDGRMTYWMYYGELQ